MIKCTACGFDNKADAKFCLNCGADLSKSAPPSEVYDPVGEEATVLIDPAQMQKRIAEEFKRDRAVDAVSRLSEPAPAAVPTMPPPAAAAVASSFSSGASSSPPPPPAKAARGGSTAMLIGLIVVVLFLLLVVAGLLVALVMMR